MLDSVYAPIFFPLCDFFDFSPLSVPVLALYFSLTKWAQPFHPASPRPSSVTALAAALTAVVHQVASLAEGEMSAAAGLLHTDDVVPQSIVHTQNI